MSDHQNDYTKTQLDDDLDAVMRKYDRESNTRIWQGTPRLIERIILAGFSLYCIYVTLFATFLEEIRLNISC